MTENILQFSTLFQKILGLFKRYAIIISICLFAGLTGYILALTNSITGEQPTQESIDTKLKSVPRPKIDQSIVNTILGLEDRNIDMQTIFQDARKSPFNE